MVAFRSFPAALALVALCTPNAAWADEPTPEVYTSSSPWAIDYADDSCALRRTFTSGDKKLELEMRQFQPEGDLAILVSSPVMDFAAQEALIRFGPDDDYIAKPRAFRAKLSNGWVGITFHDELVPSSDVSMVKERRADYASYDYWDEHDLKARFREINNLSIKGALAKPISLELGPMLKPEIALERCISELLTHWGIDAEAHRTLSRDVNILNLKELVKKVQRNYPKKMLYAEKSGIVRARLNVDETGKPSACHMQIAAQNREFEETSCNLLMKVARFDPALDKDGKPIASYWINSITYVVN